MKSVAFYTLGCKVNQFDTEAMKQAFAEKGYTIMQSDDKADVYVINTCTVTSRSDAKSRQAIRRAIRQNPSAVVAVTGCYSQVAPDVVAHMPGVDVVAGTNQAATIVQLVERAVGERQLQVERGTDWLKAVSSGGRTRAMLKIQEGCEQYCSYCIVPYARGGLRSRSADDVLREVQRLVDHGYKEIVLTGVHLGAYGRETAGPDLTQIIRLLGGIHDLKRLRLSSIEPIDIDESLFDALKQLDSFCEHLHLPLQSGCSSTLLRMNRPYTASQYAKIVESARRVFPDIGISTDVIVGFPGETEAEFEESVRFVREMQFSRLHVFRFSPRKGTPAASFPDKVGVQQSKRRSSELIHVGEQLACEFHNRFIGRKLEVLVEEQSNAQVCGFSRNYIRVCFDGNEELRNLICDVKIEAADVSGAYGSITSGTTRG